MFAYYGNALNVVTTNRMVQNEFSKTAGDNIANEMALLWERGAFRNGLFRGIAPVVAFNVCSWNLQKYSLNLP